MKSTRLPKLMLIAALLLSALIALPVSAARSSGQAIAPSQGQRYIVVAKSDAEYDALRADLVRAGSKILHDLRSINTLVVSGASSANLQTAAVASTHAAESAPDHVISLIQPDGQKPLTAPKPQRSEINLDGAKGDSFNPDPAFDLPGLLWNVDRIHSQEAWETTTGDKDVLVAVADTGLDYTHSDLRRQVVHVEDFTTTEDPPICKSATGVSDQDLAAEFGVPVDLDFNGHGSWIGGNIAARRDGKGINGIAPGVKLVSLKISQWCGSAYDSELLAAFIYAADHNIDIVSISFGGYTDRNDPDQNVIYKAYVRTVKYAREHGTVIVAASGNEHVRIGEGGRVISHGILNTPGDPLLDLFGLWEAPGGIPGVVDVSSTGNVVASPSKSCPADTLTLVNTPCKPKSDAHQPFGVGKKDQLAYYSNYGPRIDIAAPGGARKFNLPFWDRGGTPGFPYTTDDGTTAFETFSITSNYAQGIPCFLITGGGFPKNQCYSTIQGTSMATPHVSAVLALIASAHPNLRHKPAALVEHLKATAREIHGNTTPPLSATDTSAADLTGDPCPSGYCHLGGNPISDSDAYGAGLVDAARAVGDD